MPRMLHHLPVWILPGLIAMSSMAWAAPLNDKVTEVLENYCFDCHAEGIKKGGFDMDVVFDNKDFDGTLMFENVINAKMPPADEDQPTAEEKAIILNWLAKHQPQKAHDSYRRISRHEFTHSLNDLLGTDLNLVEDIPEDRGTNYFDTDRSIKLSREMLASYFAVADRTLEDALPAKGHRNEEVWVTGKIRDSHETYRIYHRPYEEGTLFSWTRANNGNSYSFFIDGFDPPVSGWYELTFEAAKVGEFKEDVSLQVHAGKYYYADDRPQPQRLIDVISLSNKELKAFTVRAYLHPGESVSVHAHSKHNFRQRNPKVGAYLKQMKARGPLVDAWPTTTYTTLFKGLPIQAPERKRTNSSGFQTKLQKIGGSVSVSSEEKGMEKEKMQDGSNTTFWHTRYTPTVAKPPHFVVFSNPNGAEITGLSFATWTGGNGNGLIKAYEIHFSDDGKAWGDKVMSGGLDVRLGNEQFIVFPKPTRSQYIRLLATDAVSLDGKSLASIGKLDVMIPEVHQSATTKIKVAAKTPKELKLVIKRFAERAFSSKLNDEELAPYYHVALDALSDGMDFVQAAKLGLKAVISSPRFLMAPGKHANPSEARAAALARILWLSVPDEELRVLAAKNGLDEKTLRAQVSRMVDDPKAERMIESLSAQWLNLRGLGKVTPSLKLYPLFDDLMDHYLPLETQAYVGYLIRENLSPGHLIDSNFSFLNQRLAQHYGVDGVYGQELRKVSFPEGSPRGGLMTMASILKVTTDGHETSPILRGAWVSKNIMGTPLSPPPPNVKVVEPDHSGATTLREQIEEHKKNKACYACHKSIDPYGFALEDFDASGQWRDRYRIKQPHKGTFQYRPKGFFKLGAKVDSAGELGEQKFVGVQELKAILLRDQRKVAYNFAKKFFKYANGHPPSLEQRLQLWRLVEDGNQQAGMKDIVTEVLVLSLIPDPS